MNITTTNNKTVDFDDAVNLMDDEIREEVHGLGLTDEQEFYDEYVKRHAEKFEGEEFTVN